MLPLMTVLPVLASPAEVPSANASAVIAAFWATFCIASPRACDAAFSARTDRQALHSEIAPF